MKQRSMILAAVAMIPFAVSAAQTPPTPPVQPTPATPVIVPAPGQKPLMPLTPLPGEPIYIDREAIRRAVEDAKWQGEEGRRMAEQGKWLAEDVRRLAEDAKWQAKVHLEDLKFDFNHDFKFDFNHDFKFDFDHDMKFDLKIDPKMSIKAPNFAFTPMPGQNGATLWTPQQYQQYQDPADSMYQLGREMLGRQDYSRAAAKLGEMIAKYPGSRNVTAASYWQAFALFRVGTMEALRNSLKILETNAQTFQYSNSSYRNDAPSLHARVLRALADRNESGADAKLRDLIARYPSERCDVDKVDIQSTVLNSLYQADPEAAAPYIKQYLETKDACTAKLRISAIYLLANRGSEANTNLIVQLAKNDTVRSVRTEAITALSRMPGDASINALQQLMSDDDEAVQRAAVRSLMRSDNPRARAAMRMSVIDKRDAPERQRIEAINSLTDNNMTPDDAVYLRGLFKRQGESDRIKDAIVNALGRVPNDENLKFLMDVAQDQNESSSIRANALRRVTARQNLSTDNLIKLYDATDNRSMRNSLVDALAQRPEPAALNKLLDIVKSSTDPDVRSNAIQELLRKNDKAITQRVLDLIGKPTTGGL
jgi:outer membrane protein assembly factor BamD (BamD/ComL family)